MKHAIVFCDGGMFSSLAVIVFLGLMDVGPKPYLLSVLSDLFFAGSFSLSDEIIANSNSK